MAQVTEMYRVINFVLEMKTLGLRMVPIFNDGVWKLEALSDCDFENDKDTRYSVYGYIIKFCGVPVAWKSKSMKSVVLSTTEAEYVAVSEGMLEGIVATRRTSGQTVGPRVCSYVLVMLEVSLARN